MEPLAQHFLEILRETAGPEGHRIRGETIRKLRAILAWKHQGTRKRDPLHAARFRRDRSSPPANLHLPESHRSATTGERALLNSERDHGGRSTETSSQNIFECVTRALDGNRLREKRGENQVKAAAMLESAAIRCGPTLQRLASWSDAPRAAHCSMRWAAAAQSRAILR